MKMLYRAALALLALSLCAPLAAVPIRSPAGFAPLQAGCADDGTGECAAIDGNWPFKGATALTLDASYPAGRSILLSCTVAGNVSLIFANGSTLVVPVQVGATILPFAVTRVASADTTATCTYANLQ